MGPLAGRACFTGNQFNSNRFQHSCGMERAFEGLSGAKVNEGFTMRPPFAVDPADQRLCWFRVPRCSIAMRLAHGSRVAGKRDNVGAAVQPMLNEGRRCSPEGTGA